MTTPHPAPIPAVMFAPTQASTGAQKAAPTWIPTAAHGPGGGQAGRPVLHCAHLTKSFGRTEALRGVDLSVRAGQVLAIMGPSGSGKSTLLHCLAGVYAPDGGTVHFRDRELSAASEPERAAVRLRHFGFVFQFGQLLPELSALDNICVPLLLNKTSRRAATRAAREWLERLDVGHLAGTVPGKLSGGEAQRVAIARAMAGNPDVVFADEPTGALDSLAAENVMTVLTSVAREHNTTVLIITHDARTASYADQTVIVRDGRLAASSGGPPVGSGGPPVGSGGPPVGSGDSR